MTSSAEWEHRLGSVQLVRVADAVEAGDPSVVDLERDQPVEFAAVTSVLSIAAAISPWVYPNTSCSTNTARSVGFSVSRTSSMAIDTDSARIASSLTSGAVRIGSGSHEPMYSACRVTTRIR